ncbi:LysR family transcriptional regulator [Oricola indica]|uniref:LysR family transcriptional regulator n=1 Tax=Oricola indica TaxID=2872591 RepID=UPI003CCBB047
MELRQIQYLIALFEEGSVTRAARRLNIVQPAISQQLSKLEDELGQALFHRTPKGMVPTQAGCDAYRMLRPVLQGLENARQELSAPKGAVKGHLSIGVVSSITNNTLSETLLRFNAAHPEVTIRATGGYTSDLLDLLKSAQLDIAIVNSPPKGGPFDQQTILEEDFALICAADQARKFDGPVNLVKAPIEPLVLPSIRHGLRGVMESLFSAHGVELRSRIEIDELSVIEDVISRSEYTTILPPTAVNKGLLNGSLVCIDIKPHIARRIVAATSHSRPINTPARLFIKMLQQTTSEILEKLQLIGPAKI